MKKNILILPCIAGMPEEALKAIARLQANLQASLIPGQVLSSPSPYQEMTTRLYQPIPSSPINDFFASVCVDNVKNPQIVNILGLMSFFVYGTLAYNVVGGQLDFFHPHRRVHWKFCYQTLPYFGNVPDTGQYSLKQREIYWLLSNLPFDNGLVKIDFQEGEPFSIYMESNDYLCITKQE